MKEELRSVRIRELVEYFLHEGMKIVSAKGISGYRQPAPLPNDGYGDQRPQQPDVLAFNDKEKCFVIGVVRLEKKELDSEKSLMQYNVFLDQKDSATGKPYRLFVMVPASQVHEMTSLLTHYIHRDYWNRMTIVSSRAEEQ